MESDEPAFDEFSRRIGRFFVAWAFMESSVNAALNAIIDNYVEPKDGFDKPRNFSKKIEFIRRFFREHRDWQFLQKTTNELTAAVDSLADGRHALAHGQIVDVDAAIQGPKITILLTKRNKGKERLYEYTFTHDTLLSLADRTLVHSIFVAHLAEIIRGDLGEDNLQKLIGEIVSKVGGPLPIDNLGGKDRD